MNKPLSSHSVSTIRKAAALAACIGLAATGAVACSPNGGDANGPGSAAEENLAPPFGIDSAQAELAADPKGVKALQRFFEETPDRIVVAGAGQPDQLAAARAAIADGVPLLVADSATDADVIAAIEESGADSVTAYGADVSAMVIEGVEVNVGETSPEQEPAPALTDLQSPAGLSPQGRTDTMAPEEAESIEQAGRLVAAAAAAQPAETVDATVFVTADTGVAATATARAAGARVLLLPVGDPRATPESMEAVSGGKFLAMGQDFGPQERFDGAVELAANGELPGGGGLVFPGRRMIALYGHPSGPALGLMGEQPAEEAVARVQAMVEEYQQHTQEPVIPAFEIIATVASDAPGKDGDYANETAVEDLIPYVDAITEAGGYAVLDLQPGRASLVDQARMYEELLKRPHVGLALDPEWKIAPDEVPMTNIGHVDAAEVNEVADWLAALVRENNLPQKGLILHQFQLQMIRDRETIRTDQPELSWILHADGHGSHGQKIETWNALRQDLSPDFSMAWKNFLDEDTPMYTPAETFALDPRPWFVSYQ
ncbi:cell wall-binding repeat-containing protein [Corynebacterium endometrii]|uniref:Cell wall binding repeat 2 n=1 Tax=Corynebacterium endometrii TaxID=2488819 RepID=A0A4P7QFK0_9CORY|nr:cell wall-binding repeat-containing protein [Corynebacterium endometrii]QCB28309.1 hypothetical protein CENDO_05100 [Corynebacterium endometrii]